MKRYIVTATIQGAETVDMKWYTGTSLPKAMSAMMGAATFGEYVDDDSVPEIARVKLLAVTLKIEEVE